jgi:dolichol kinase
LPGFTFVLSVAGLLAFAGTASAAPVALSGNFHVAAGAVGCRVVEYGPVSAALGSAATIRCERYSDHTFIAMSTVGKITETHSDS